MVPNKMLNNKVKEKGGVLTCSLIPCGENSHLTPHEKSQVRTSPARETAGGVSLYARVRSR